MTNNSLARIPKEEILNYRFYTQDVLLDVKDKQMRYKDLYKGLLLGNTVKEKVKVIFETTDGTKMVETTIWGLTEGFVLLKREIFIPVPSIYRVEFH